MRQIQFRDLNQNIDVLQDILLNDGSIIEYVINFDEITSLWLVSELLGKEMEPFKTYREIGLTVKSPLSNIKDFITSMEHRYIDQIENGVYRLNSFDGVEINFNENKFPFEFGKSKLICIIKFKLKSLPKY